MSIVDRRLWLAGLVLAWLGFGCGHDKGSTQSAKPTLAKTSGAHRPADAGDASSASSVSADPFDASAVSEPDAATASDDIHECTAATDCPPPAHPGECAARRCNDGRCAVDYAPRGTELAEQTAHDCRRAVCDGEGNPIQVADDADVADDGDECTKDACKGGSKLSTPVAAGTACTQDHGKFCDGSGACVECVQASDCTTHVCQGGACRPPLCGNGMLDPGEADTDCGGSCVPCPPGSACTQPADCAGMECTGNRCIANCEDGIKDNAEPATDCGAACPTQCADNQPCKKNGDCASSFCHPTQALCLEPTCDDGFANGNETGVDCGGACPACPPACQWSHECPAVDVCYPNVCVHTVNGCSIGTATDLRGMSEVTVTFDGDGYHPSCLLVTMYTKLTFSGAFDTHPLQGGQVKNGAKLPASSGPFATITNTGTSQSFAMNECATFPFYCDAHALSGEAGTVFVVSP